MIDQERFSTVSDKSVVAINAKHTKNGAPILGKLVEFFEQNFKYWTLLPAVVVVVGLTIYPFLNLVFMAFSTVKFEESQIIWTFSGLDNFYTFLEDETFITAVRNTVLFVMVTVLLEMVLGFLLALIVSQLSRMASIARAVLMVPILVPAIAIGTLWRLMYNYEFGIFNRLLTFLNLPIQNWTGDPMLAMPSIIIVDVWHWTAFIFLLMLAGIESLSVEPIEAARVDGASDWQLLRHIILPLLRPTILVALMFRTIFAFKVFDEVYLLTSGGPGNATEVISLYINRVFFGQSRMGYGAFLSLITIATTAVFVILYNRLSRANRSAS
jgi:multiple sugar transport system permease protein